MYKIGNKIIATILVTIISLANLSVIGINGKEVYATDNNLENQGVATNNTNIEFDAYFMSENKETHTSTNLIAGENNNIYTQISVKNAGYLKNAKIEFKDSESNEANFKVSNDVESDFVASINSNTVALNQIKNGTIAKIELPIEFNNSDKINITEFSKENIIKLTGTYVDGNGKEKKIEKEIKVNLGWKSNAEAILEEQISKFIPYSVNGEKGLILQTIVKSNLKDNSLPTKETNIDIVVPTINKNVPSKIKVVANSTKATNGETNAISFSEDNYSYNKETNTLNIKVANNINENNEVAWNKSVQDEFVVTYIYSEEALNTIGDAGVEVNFVASSKISAYSSQETTAAGTFEGKITLKDQINNIVDFSIETSTTELSKGYIYSNYDATEKTETEYNEQIIANVGLAEITDKIVIEQNADNFTLNEGTTKASTTVSGTNYAYYKTLTISKEMFNKIFGEDGVINIYNGETVVAKIDKTLEKNEEENIVVDLSTLNVNSIKIETTKPIAEGKVIFNITKAIKGNIDYSKYQMLDFNKLEMSAIGKAINGEATFVEQNATKEITLVEPVSKADVTINKENLSTVVTNENVEIKAILRTDSVYNNLFKNPIITLELPSYIENINIKDTKVLFGEQDDSELKIKSVNQLVDANGKKLIVITLEGTQTKYAIGAISGGTTVMLNTDITVNKLTPSKEETLKMYYTNSNVITKARSTIEENQTETKINFVAPTGVVTTTSIDGYKEGAAKLTSISGEEQTAVIETLTTSKTATFEMNVINNYTNTTDNISILGRLPFKGNKGITTNTDLGSTMDVKLQSEITVSKVDSSKVTIYYSENGEATKDLTNTSNGWTTSTTTIENIKSYLIVLNDYVMNTGDSLSFAYSAQIPENLQHNQYAYENYVVYYNNNLVDGMVQEKQASPKLEITTGTGPVLEANITSNIEENTQILEGNIIKYTLNVKNTGTENANDVKATIKVPSIMSYVEEDKTSTLGYKYTSLTDSNLQVDLGTIAAKSNITKEIWLKVGTIQPSDFCTDESHYTDNGLDQKYHSSEYSHDESEYKATPEIQASITATNIDNELKTNTAKNNIIKRYFTIEAKSSASNKEVLKENETYKYYLSVKSSNREKTRENSIITIKLPSELTYKSIKITQYNEDTRADEDKTSEAKVDFNSKTRELTIDVGTLDGARPKIIEIETTIGTLDAGVYEKEINITGNIKANNVAAEEITSVTETINKLGLKVTQTSSIPANSTIATREDYTYIFTIENPSNINMTNVSITDYLPKELVYKDVKITYADGTTNTQTKVNSDGNPEVQVSINGKATVKLEFNVVADAISETKTITNKAKVEYTGMETIESNSITHKIEKYDEETSNTDTDVKRISGQVWKDANNNGIKEESETKVSGVEVLLFNNATSKLVTDSTGEILREKTDNDGIYTFKEIPQGRYTVIFLYDVANYSATDYRKADVAAEINSDVVDSKITLDGETRTAGITEEITLASENVYNIDLGLVENKKFDLKLDKTVSSITVQNSTGTDKYEYQDSKLAKRDLVGKYIDGTTIVVEYKIAITNEGAIAGYAKKIVDYLPSELKFNAELNKDWYTSENGAIYNSSLSNTLINPGETKEVTLLLTKKMSDDGLGLINNTAEIYEAYNDLGIQDMDSTPANKISGEDDMSSADILLTVKTGEAILFIGLSITIIATIGIGAYFIKKKVLR